MPSPPRLEVLAQPFGGRALGRVVIDELRAGNWQSFRAVVAFLKRSGLVHVAAPLDEFLSQGAEVVISVGIDHDGTSLEGLQDLWRSMNGRGELYVFKEGQGGQLRTFHPKAYVFERPDRALALIGSGNLTAGGLFANHELTVFVDLDLDDPDSQVFYRTLRDAVDGWQSPSPACLPVDARLLRALYESGALLPESTIQAGVRAARATTRRGKAAQAAGRPVLFGASGATSLAPAPSPLPPMAAPPVTPPARPRPVTAKPVAPPHQPGAPVLPVHRTFLIEVRPHHNGEIFLSKRAVDEDPGFFGFPFSGWTTPKRATNSPYPMAVPDPQVELIVYGPRNRKLVEIDHSLNVVYYTSKSEIRITIPPEPLNHIPEMSVLVKDPGFLGGSDARLRPGGRRCSCDVETEEVPR